MMAWYSQHCGRGAPLFVTLCRRVSQSLGDLMMVESHTAVRAPAGSRAWSSASRRVAPTAIHRGSEAGGCQWQPSDNLEGEVRCAALLVSSWLSLNLRSSQEVER